MSNPMQSEREKLIEELMKRDGHTAEQIKRRITHCERAHHKEPCSCFFAGYVEKYGDLADYILQREASLTPLADLNDPQYFLSSVSDPVDKFNLFIKKWCLDYPHLIDSDQNDGQAMRDMLAALTPRTSKENLPVPKSTILGECPDCGHMSESGQGLREHRREQHQDAEAPKSTDPTEEFVSDDSRLYRNLCVNCGFAHWRHAKDSHPCKDYRVTPQDSTASKEQLDAK